MDFADATRILKALEREGVKYVLVGSMAMAAQDRLDAAALKERFHLEGE